MDKVALSQAHYLIKWLIDNSYLTAAEGKSYLGLVHNNENKELFLKTKKRKCLHALKMRS